MTPAVAPTADVLAAERPRRLLVGVDGSPGSVRALRRAAGMAAAMGATLKVVTCWTYAVLVGAADTVPSDLLEAGAVDAQAQALAAAFGPSRAAGLSTAVLSGDAAHVLVEESRHADLLVVGSRGHGTVAGLLLGSVSTACAERAHCDVLVVRG